MPDRPRGILRLNPGNLPEAAALEDLTHGLTHVRAVIDRETVGAVSPRRQLLAIDMLMQRHYDAIAATMRAASERHARACSASDLVRLVSAIVEHATMAMYWLYWLNAAACYRRRPVR